MLNKDIAGKIQLAFFDAYTNQTDVEAGIELAAENGFQSIYIPGLFLESAMQYLDLQKIDLPVFTPIGYPYANNTDKARWTEARELYFTGASGLVTPAPLFAIKSGNWHLAEQQLGLIREASQTCCLEAACDISLLTSDELNKFLKIVHTLQFDRIATNVEEIGFGRVKNNLELLLSLTDLPITCVQGMTNPDQVEQLLELGADRIRITSFIATT